MTAKLTDDQIFELIQVDKKAAFRMLMRQYQEPIYWHIRKMVTYHEDADDVVQNTFLKVWKNLDRFEGKSKLFTWLFRIATNESITFLKKRKRKQTDSIDSEESSITHRLEADKYFDGNKAQLMLQNALATLPSKQKIVFNLRYFDELSYQEISERLETSVGALKASYHHAVKKIEVYIKNEK